MLWPYQVETYKLCSFIVPLTVKIYWCIKCTVYWFLVRSVSFDYNWRIRSRACVQSVMVYSSETWALRVCKMQQWREWWSIVRWMCSQSQNSSKYHRIYCTIYMSLVNRNTNVDCGGMVEWNTVLMIGCRSAGEFCCSAKSRGRGWKIRNKYVEEDIQSINLSTFIERLNRMATLKHKYQNVEYWNKQFYTDIKIKWIHNSMQKQEP
jgi:hypothetical protein